MLMQAIQNMKPVTREHFANSAAITCPAAGQPWDVVSNCVEEGQTAIFDGSVFLWPGMTVELIRFDLNGPAVCASVALASTATIGEQVPLIYSETVAEDAKFILRLSGCESTDTWAKQAISYFYEVYKKNGTTETVRFN